MKTAQMTISTAQILSHGALKMRPFWTILDLLKCGVLVKYP